MSVDIRRPVADVFAYVDDVAREHEWQTQLLEAEQIPPWPPAIGTRRRYVSQFMGRRVENTYVIRVYDPPRHVALETTDDSSLSATSDIRFDAIAGGTRVTMTVEGSAHGALRLVPRRVLEATLAREVDRALSRLKERLES